MNPKPVCPKCNDANPNEQSQFSTWDHTAYACEKCGAHFAVPTLFKHVSDVTTRFTPLAWLKMFLLGKPLK
jgi:transposase-like protein